jgi:hypothetical protein
MFSSTLEKGDTMNKITFPLCKSGSFITKDLGIPKQPNVSACHNNHLHEERLSKTQPGRSHDATELMK